jgi:hypothetical protein
MVNSKHLDLPNAKCRHKKMAPITNTNEAGPDANWNQLGMRLADSEAFKRFCAFGDA